MKLKNILIVVENIEKAKQFYKTLFGLESVLDQGETVILTEGLVLQEKKIWEETIDKEVIAKSNAAELYFEENDLEAFAQKLENAYPEITYVTPLTNLPWGQKVMRFYDLDGNLIEIRD